MSAQFLSVEAQKRLMQDRGMQFQSTFEAIMEVAFGPDFNRVRPHGAIGDQKCDGYLGGHRIVFGVYAPDDLNGKTTLPRAKRKIAADLRGAVKHWREHMSSWVLQHNRGDLPAPLLKLILAGNLKYQGISVAHWTSTALLGLCAQLSVKSLIGLFGAVPTTRDVQLGVRQKDLARILRRLGQTLTETYDDTVEPVPPGKIEFNNLTQHTAALLRIGQIHHVKVADFFGRDPDVELEAKIVGDFSRRYRELRDEGLLADEIFIRLKDYAESGAQTSSEQVAALAVIAYLFQACHIFERPDVEKPDAPADQNPASITITGRSGSNDSEAAQ